MGKADKSTRDYINDADVFADAFNYLMYDGDSVVDATTLKPLDTSLLLNVFGIESQTDIPDERALRFIQDYKIFLIEPNRMTDDDFDKFSSDLGKVLKFMQRASDKDKMRELMAEASYSRIDRKAAQVIRDCANVDIEIDSSEEMINMCKAWQDAQEETAILTAIDSWRDVKISDEIIKDKIMAKYNLTENEADEYMMKTSVILS